MTKNSKTTVPELGDHGDNKSISSQHVRKRDKIRNLFRSDKPETHAKPLAVQPEAEHQHTDSASIKVGDDNSSTHSSITVSNSKASTRPTTEKAKVRSDIFSTNVAKPVVKPAVPKFGARIENTLQLALCSSLLPKSSTLSPSDESDLQSDLLQIKETSQGTPIDDTSREWIKAIEQNPIEQSHVRWLLERMVEEFLKDAVKGSAAVTEVILLGPVLDYEHYRKLLNCLINEFEKATILDVDLLHGLVQLVQCASKDYLIADDLIKILSILRTRLQQTHQQSTKHPYHLTLAVSRLLDVMAKHEVKDLDRVEQHEPLGDVLSSLRDSSDPFLMYQASYAFQALQCVPDDETVLQAVIRHSGVVAESLIGISGVINLNLSGFLEGLSQLQKTIVDTIGIAKSATEGVRSLIESGKGVFEAIKEGVHSGNKRAWYPAIIGSSALIQEGRLADFKTVVMEATCRQSPELQWGICQLLGEIAVDSTWESGIRREAVDFLVDLYTNDPDWGRDASVKTWILTIFRIISEHPEQSIFVPAAILQQEIDKAEAGRFAKPYPLMSRLPVPVASPLLDRVQEVPVVERDLDQLRCQRLRKHDQKVYIPPQAKASLQASDKETMPLMDLVTEFLGSDQQVFLVLGDSGAGKSTFNRHLENELWKRYKIGGPIPLFINLPAVSEQYQDIIGKQLRIHSFSEEKIKELKKHREMILVCDGYDETQLKINLHTTNMLNQEGQPNTKMIISCRSTYLGQDYRNLFQPQHSDRYTGTAAILYTEAVIVPFSSGQIEDYVDQFVRDPEVHKLMGESRVWSTEDYMSKLRSIPNMMDLVKNPFLLSLSLRSLPRVVKDAVDLAKVKVTRLTLYNSFTDQWLDINKRRLENSTLPADAAKALQELLEEGFTSSAITFLKCLAAAIFEEQGGNPVVQYTPRSDKRTWKFKYFGPEPGTVLLRESSPLSRAGVQYRFMHRSLLEYFYSRHIYETNATESLVSEGSQHLADHPLSQMNLVKESSIIDFLAEHVHSDLAFKQQLHQIIELSKIDANASQAAANAITTLVRAGVTFNGTDLRSIKIPGADLSGGEFDSAQLQGADLNNTNLRGIWLRQADLSKAHMAGTQFGEWPFLEEECSVTSCAYSPDGKSFACGLEDGTISMYETTTWRKVSTLSGHTYAVLSVVFSPSSRQIASGGDDKTVRLWDAQTSALSAILSRHSDKVMSVVFSPSGQQIASASADMTVRLWDAQTGVPGAILSGHTSSVNSVAFSPSGQQIASGSHDNTVRLWDAQTGAPGAILSGHKKMVMSVVYSPGGQQIASGGDERTVRLWDSRTGALCFLLEVDTYVMSVVFSPSGQQIALGGLDSTARLWDAQTGSPGAILRGHMNLIRSVVFSPSGHQIASGSDDKTVRLWDAHNGSPGAILKGHTDLVCRVVFSPSGQQIASGSNDNTVRLWDTRTGTPNAILNGHISDVTSVVFSPSGQQIASGSRDKTVRLWDAQTGALRATLRGHTKRVRSVVFSPSGQQLASGSDDKTVRLWDARTGALSLLLKGHTSYVRSVVFSPSGQQIASGSKDMTVRLWDVQTGVPGAILSGHTFWVRSVIFSPNGQQIASGSQDETVRLWDAQIGAPGTTLSGHTSDVTSVVFSPSGQQIASGSRDKTVRLWDAQTGAPGAILSGHTNVVNSVVFSPCGQQIASASSDETIRLWDVESGRCLSVVRGFHGAIASLAWKTVGNDSYIVTGCYDKSVRVWKVTRECHLVCLHWSSGHGQLAVSDTKMSNVRGLSSMNMRLLEQRGASRSPSVFESAKVHLMMISDTFTSRAFF